MFKMKQQQNRSALQVGFFCARLTLPTEFDMLIKNMHSNRRNNMKHGYRIQLVLMSVILLGTAVLMAFLADSVPVSFSGTSVSDVGSKYETLLFPIFSLVMGGGALYAAKMMEFSRPIQKIVQVVGFIFTGVFGIFGFVLMAKALRFGSDRPDALTLAAILLAAAMAVYAHSMPYQNTASATDETRKCRMLVSHVFLIAAALMLLASIFLPGIICLPVACALILAALVFEFHAKRRSGKETP